MGAAPLNKALGIDFAATPGTVQKHELGIEIEANDGKKYKYIRAGAAIAATDALKVDVAEGVNDFDPAGATLQPIAGIADKAFNDNEYGWVIVRGSASCKAAATVVAGAHAVSTGTAGTLDDTAAAADVACALAAGKGATFQTTTSGGLATVILS